LGIEIVETRKFVKKWKKNKNTKKCRSTGSRRRWTNDTH